MTKFIYRLFSLALVTILGFSITFNVAASSQMTTAVYFETCDVPEDVIECFANNIDGLAKSVAITYNVNADKIAFGGFYPIRGTENMYYIPVYFESECLCLVTYRLQDDIVSLNYSSAASDCLNNLPNGVYYFENVNNCNFIVGAEAVFEIETMYSLEENDVEWPTYNPEDNDSVMNIRGGLQYIGIGRQTRDVSTNSLDVPLYANGGNPGYGYCWLSCCASIMEYYGYAPSSLSGIHAYKHSDHALDYCVGGSIEDARDTICYYSGKTGMTQNGRISAGTVQSQINAGKPVYSVWSHYNDSGIRDAGHAMVITGYTYVDNTRSFTYKIMDPNCSNYVYIYSNSSDTQVTYSISGDTYIWDKTMYNFY